MTKRCENELIIIVKEIVADLMESIKLKKKQKLRNNEYYNLQNIFDKLYEDSKNNKKFKNILKDRKRMAALKCIYKFLHRYL